MLIQMSGVVPKIVCKTIIVIVACVMSLLAAAQIVPDAGSVQREFNPPPAVLSPKLQSTLALEAKVLPGDRGALIYVSEFIVTGVNLIPGAAVIEALAPWRGRELYFSELQVALESINSLYADKGWLARAQLPVQDIVDGRVFVEVIEARLGRLEIEATDQFPISSARVINTLSAYVENAKVLNLDQLNQGLYLLNDLPGVELQAALASGEQRGDVDILLSSLPESRFDGSLLVDNWGHASTGTERLSLNVNANNPSRTGDQVRMSLMSSQAVHYGRLDYSVPVGYTGMRLSLGASQLDYKLIGSFAALESRGEAKTLTIRLSRPVMSSKTAMASLALAHSASRYVNEANAIVISEKSLQASMLSLNGYWLGTGANAGIAQWLIALSAGNLDLSANLDNQLADASGLRSAGDFEKLNLSASYITPLSQLTTLIVSLAGQYAKQNLDSSQKFSLGGPQGMRAHPSSEGAGDDGFMLNVEIEATVAPQTKVSAFYDFGEIRLNKVPAGSSLAVPNKYSLRGWGVSAGHRFGQRSEFKLTFGRRIGDNPAASDISGNDNDGTLIENRVWLSWMMNL